MRTLRFFLMSAVLLATAAACSDSDDGTTADPLSGTWRITQIQVSQQQLVQIAPSNENILITFESGGTFNGQTSVNQFSGRYELNGTTLTMLEFTTTEVADTQFATAFYNAIAEAQVPDQTFAQFGFSFDNQDLIMVFGNSGSMTLEPQ
ncbi:MAG: META domain-containing protein [Flavobacteriaceae bacterium]|nr:META domain-containing protein [Flavobacteriaceae bacterium]